MSPKSKASVLQASSGCALSAACMQHVDISQDKDLRCSTFQPLQEHTVQHEHACKEHDIKTCMLTLMMMIAIADDDLQVLSASSVASDTPSTTPVIMQTLTKLTQPR